MLCIIKKCYIRQKYHLRKRIKQTLFVFSFFFAQANAAQIAGAANSVIIGKNKMVLR
jgi:hypothetical protein